MKNVRLWQVVILVLFMVSPYSVVAQEKVGYLCTPKITNEYGIPTDTLLNYFPNNGLHVRSIDPYQSDFSGDNWQSSTLWFAKEPILYNCYLGHDRFRFMYLIDNYAIIVTIHRLGDSVWIHRKNIDNPPFSVSTTHYYRYVYHKPHFFDRKRNRRDSSNYEYEDIFATAKITSEYNCQLTMQQWDTFLRLVKECNFWTMPAKDNRIVSDGSDWILEAHEKYGYHEVTRNEPMDKFRKCGEYLMEVSEPRRFQKRTNNQW